MMISLVIMHWGKIDKDEPRVVSLCMKPVYGLVVLSYE